jgi:hypothetical protein
MFNHAIPSDSPLQKALREFPGENSTLFELHKALVELGVSTKGQEDFCSCLLDRERGTDLLEEFSNGLAREGISVRARVLRPLLERHGIAVPAPFPVFTH